MSEMYGVVNETYFCNLERTEELNERRYETRKPHLYHLPPGGLVGLVVVAVVAAVVVVIVVVL